MKTLLIEKNFIGPNKIEVIMLHDLENKKSSFIFTSEFHYKEWVIAQAIIFRSKGYFIFNYSDIILLNIKF